ncbi:hypothetical protein L7F22_061981 [Adiantum nelumboides]|nr:hypothetical protein [Adiantum nelumboides]
MGDAMKADGAFIGQDASVTPLIGKLRLHIQGYVDKEDFFISPLKHEDVILGAPWFDRLAASIKFPKRKMSFKFREKDMYIVAQESCSTIPLVNNQAFDKSIKSSISVYIIFVNKDSLSDVNKTQVNESGMHEELELSKFLNQFQDVFIDAIPEELPPKQGDDDHAIELIPGSSPPNKPPYRVSQAQQEEILLRQVNELVEKRMSVLSTSTLVCHQQSCGQASAQAIGWREYWDSKLVNIKPPSSLQELASPLASQNDIEASFICISHARYSLCLCTRLDINICAAANISGGPVASTCIFHFFYEYHKNCKQSNTIPGRGPHEPIDQEATGNSTHTFFKSTYLCQNLNAFIPIPPLSNPLLQSQAFLPRPLANMLPFNTLRLAESLSLLHVLPLSPMAESMQSTLEFCESSSPQDEESLQCITSIESMVDFVSQKLGDHVMVLTSTLATSEISSMAKIDKVVNMDNMVDDTISTCHNLVYPYLVYGCHVTRGSSVMRVSFEGIEGEAIVVCHHNTSLWNPSHPAFEQLQTNPGDGEEICHWIPQHHFEEVRLIDFGTLDLQNVVASLDATWTIEFLARKMQEAMTNLALQCGIHTQLQERHLTVPTLEENSPSKSQHEASKRGNSNEQSKKKNVTTTRRRQSSPHEAKARKKTKDTREKSPVYDIDTLATFDLDVIQREEEEIPLHHHHMEGDLQALPPLVNQRGVRRRLKTNGERRNHPALRPPQSSSKTGNSSSSDNNSSKTRKEKKINVHMQPRRVVGLHTAI